MQFMVKTSQPQVFSSSLKKPNKQTNNKMAFIKSILFAAFVAVVTAQFEGINIQESAQQIQQIQNATSGVTGGTQFPGADQLPVDQEQLGQLPVGSTSEAPATEAPSRLTDRITNGLNGIRGSRHH